MTGFFPFAHHKRVSKNEIRKQLGVSADETYQSDFLEAAVLNFSAKGATTLRKERRLAVEHPGHSLSQQKSEQK